MENSKEKSNIVLGILGAIIGAFLGSILWILIGMLGFIAGLAGYLMFVFAMKGYKILGGSIDTKGKIVSLVIAIIMIVFANYMYYLIDSYKYLSMQYDNDVLLYAKSFPGLMTKYSVWPGFAKDLLIGLVLTIVSSLSAIKAIFSKEKSDEDTTEASLSEGNGQDTEYSTYYQDSFDEK